MLFAAVFAALLLILVHPFCSVTYAGTTIHHASTVSPDTGDTLPDTCCSDAKDGALVKPAGVLVALAAEGTFGAAPGSWIRLPGWSSEAGAAANRVLAVPERSYYARSARILR